MSATRSDESTLGGDVYIPFKAIETPQELSITAPKNGDVIEHSAALAVSALTTAAGAEAKLYVDGTVADTVTSTGAYTASFSADISALPLGEHTLKVECSGQSKEITVELKKQNVVTSDLQDFENVTASQVADTYDILYTVPQKIDGVASGAYKKLVSGIEGHGNVAGVFMPAGESQSRRNSFTSLLYLKNTTGHGANVGSLSGNISLEYDFFIEDASDKAYLGFEWHKDVTGMGITNSSGTIQSSVRTLFYPDGSSDFGNFISGGAFFGTKQIENKTWYKIKFDFNITEQICTAYIDGEPVKTFGFGTLALNSGYKNSEGNDATLEDVGITDGKIGGITWVNLSHIRNGAHENVIGMGNNLTDVCCYLVDNIKSTVYNPVPEINTYAPSYFYGTKSTLSVSLDRNYANLASNKDNIKLYINGTETTYESVTFENKKAVFTLSAPVALNASARVVFGNALTLEDGVTAAGVSNEATLKCALYSGENGLYLIPVQNGATVTLTGANAGSGKAAKLIVCSYSGEGRLLDVKIKEVQLGKEIEAQTDAVNLSGAVKAQLLVFDLNEAVTPLTESFELSAQ